ncbi:MAG: sensor histidine kinase [Coprobacillaceae bacterium]
MLKKWIRKIRMSLTTRLFIITASLLIMISTVTYIIIALATPISFTILENDELQSKLTKLAQELENTTMEDCTPLLDAFMIETGLEPIIIDQNNISHFLSSYNNPSNHGDITNFEANNNSPSTNRNSNDSEMHVVNFSFNNSNILYTLTTSIEVRETNQTTAALKQVAPYLIICIFCISITIAFMYSRYITKPIVKLNNISKRIANLDFTYIYTNKRIDEIGLLGSNMNTMSNSLSSALSRLHLANQSLQQEIDKKDILEEQRMTFFAAASHELKTPVTILKGQLRGMLDGVGVYKDHNTYLARSLRTTERIEKLVREILEVSRMDNTNLQTNYEDIDMSSLVNVHIESIVQIAKQKEITIDKNIAAGIFVQGDSGLIDKVVSNLLSNALNHSPNNATIIITLNNNNAPLLTIENSESHIPKESLPYIFDAFYLVDTSRSKTNGGSGLGLYLVKKILDYHHARCDINNTNNGVIVSVQFSTQTTQKIQYRFK